jgi:hypothetical protein
VKSFPDTIRELFELVRSYATQELYEPLKGLPMYVGLGLVGALMTAFGAGLLLLGVLRLIQTEWIQADADQATSAIPYLIVAAAAVLVIYLLVRRINRQFGAPS